MPLKNAKPNPSDDKSNRKKLKRLGRKEAIAQLHAIADLYQKRPATKRLKLPVAKRPTIDDLREIIDYIRVCVKYRELDVESLKREVKYFKKLLDNNGNV